jgi:queuosine biosynthesis protein QueC
MCGVAAFYARDSKPSIDVLDKMFEWCSKRGADGCGFVVLDKGKDNKYSIGQHYVSTKTYQEAREEILKGIYCELGDIVLMICRAAPETEVATSEDNMQPLVGSGCVLIHNGAVSQRIVDELKFHSHYQFRTQIDSEAIISAYTKHGRNIKETMEYLSGGFAFILVDLQTSQMHIVNDFKPISTGYIKGLGYMVASDVCCIRDVIEMVTDCKRDGMNLWEYYYANPQMGPKIRTVDLESGFERFQDFRPRYITNKWDSSTQESKEELCLVAASGGLDSTVTLATLKHAGYKNIVACHFKYGHRGQDCEQKAIEKITSQLNIQLKIFNLQPFYSDMMESSSLLDVNAEIRTGTDEALKTTEAWVPGRNMMMLTHMATWAESLVMKHNYSKVYLLGGFLNLAESGFYPDNCEDFVRSFLTHLRFGTLVGDRFKPLYCLSNLMKSEQWVLADKLGILNIIQDTISCDRPKLIDGVPHNCTKNGLPACGSGLLSWWAAKMVGMEDNRKFYEITEDYVPHKALHLETGKKLNISIDNIIDRILIPDDKKLKLKDYINGRK